MTTEDIKTKIAPILKKYGVTKAAFFGSMARGETTDESDVDILVEIADENMSMLDFIRLKMKIEEAIGKKVDLVEYSTIKPLIREKILKEQIGIL